MSEKEELALHGGLEAEKFLLPRFSWEIHDPDSGWGRASALDNVKVKRVDPARVLKVGKESYNHSDCTSFVLATP